VLAFQRSTEKEKMTIVRNMDNEVDIFFHPDMNPQFRYNPNIVEVWGGVVMVSEIAKRFRR
jgi:hypothetical protein